MAKQFTRFKIIKREAIQIPLRMNAKLMFLLFTVKFNLPYPTNQILQECYAST